MSGQLTPSTIAMYVHIKVDAYDNYLLFAPTADGLWMDYVATPSRCLPAFSERQARWLRIEVDWNCSLDFMNELAAEI